MADPMLGTWRKWVNRDIGDDLGVFKVGPSPDVRVYAIDYFGDIDFEGRSFVAENSVRATLLEVWLSYETATLTPEQKARCKLGEHHFDMISIEVDGEWVTDSSVHDIDGMLERVDAALALPAPADKVEVDHALATAPAASADQSRPSLEADPRVRPSTEFLRMQIGALVRRTVNNCVGTHSHAEFFVELVRALGNVGHEIVRER